MKAVPSRKIGAKDSADVRFVVRWSRRRVAEYKRMGRRLASRDHVLEDPWVSRADLAVYVKSLGDAHDGRPFNDADASESIVEMLRGGRLVLACAEGLENQQPVLAADLRREAGPAESTDYTAPEQSVTSAVEGFPPCGEIEAFVLSSRMCGGCHRFVWVDCKVDAAGEPPPCSGICKDCRAKGPDEGALAVRSLKTRTAPVRRGRHAGRLQPPVSCCSCSSVLSSSSSSPLRKSPGFCSFFCIFNCLHEFVERFPLDCYELSTVRGAIPPAQTGVHQGHGRGRSL